MEKLSPDARYFYLFLMTNPLCTECGIYQITLKKICNYTGYNEDSVKALIRVFEVENSRIVYDTSTEEMCLLKKPNYIENTGKPVLDCLKSEFSSVKNKELIIRQLKHIEKDAIRTVYASYHGTTYASYNKLEQEKEKEKEKEENKKDAPSNEILASSNLFRKPNIPTKNEVWEVFQRNGGTKEMAKAFFEKNEALEWFLNGSPITNFASLVPKYIDSWKRNENKGAAIPDVTKTKISLK